MPPPVIRVPKYIGRNTFLDVPAYTGNASKALVVNGSGDGFQYVAVALATHAHAGEDITSGTVADARIASTITRDNEVMTIVLAGDGSGSGLDADLLRGVTPSAYILTLADDADAATARATLGLGALATAGVPGSTTQVISNQAGVLAGDAGMTYDPATDALTVAGRVVTGVIRPLADGLTALKIKTAADADFVTLDTTGGNLGVGVAPSAHIHVKSVADSRIGMIIQANSATQSANMLEYRDYNGTVLSAVNRLGWGIGITGSPSYKIDAQESSNVQIARFANSNASFPAVIQIDRSSVARGAAIVFTTGGSTCNWYVGMAYRSGGTSNNFYIGTASNFSPDSTTAIISISTGGLVGLGLATTAPTALAHLAASTTTRAQLRFDPTSAADPTSPNDGDAWYNSRLKFRRGATTEIFATGVQAAGGVATAGATYGATEQTMLQAVYNVARTFGLLS